MASPSKSSFVIEPAEKSTTSKHFTPTPEINLLDADNTALRPSIAPEANSSKQASRIKRPLTPPVTPTEPERSECRHRYFSPSSASAPLRSPPLTLQTSGHGPGRNSAGSETRQDLNSPATIHDDNSEPSPKILAFPHWDGDYTLGEGKKRKLLGSGLWSDVYLATPITPETRPSCFPSQGQAPKAGIDTPPHTPVHSREYSWSTHLANPPKPTPTAYAVKVPASRTAKEVLVEEARTLTYLSHSRSSEFSKHVVGFYGLDSRNDALVMKAMDTTLENWTKQDLNVLDQEHRAKELSGTFEKLARDLLDGVLWLGEKGCTHADIKPSNILLATGPDVLHAVYSDFSSAVLEPHLSSEAIKATKAAGTTIQAPLGGGTWDFLDPTLLTAATASPAPSPSQTGDLWALAITLLYIIIGASPFDCAGTNKFRRREFVKQGTPIDFALSGDDALRNKKRLERLAADLGWDITAWLGMVLKKDVGGRKTGCEWRDLMGVDRGP